MRQIWKYHPDPQIEAAMKQIDEGFDKLVELDFISAAQATILGRQAAQAANWHWNSKKFNRSDEPE